MDEAWHNWLTAQHAVIENGYVAHFGNPEQEAAATVNGSIITDLNHYGLLQVEGVDAGKFLQSQLGNDVQKVHTNSSQLNSYSSAKGRMYCIFRLFRRDDAFILRMPQELIPLVQKRLQMFVLMSKVKLMAVGNRWLRIGVAGEAAGARLDQHLNTLPLEINAVTRSNGITVMRVPGNRRYELYGSYDELCPLWQTLAPHLTPVGHNAWPLLDILNGIPTLYPQTSEHFVPQMTNMQQIDGVSFKKGCYPGQEVVARMQYLGKLKRRMYRFELETTTRPEPGTEIVALSDGNSHATGEIVDARLLSGDRYAALAVLQSSNIEQPLHLQNAAGPRLYLQKLPYLLE